MPQAVSRLSALFSLPRPRAAAPIQAGGGSTLGQDTLTTTANPVLSKLNATQAEAYGRLNQSQRQSFDRIFLASDPMSKEPLKRLLESKRLLSLRDLHGGATLLTNLDQLVQEPLAAGVDRRGLVSSALKQAENPGEISQGGRGTCTVTTVEYMLAKQAPAEYVRVLAGLATGDGSVKLANGKTAKRVPDSTAQDDSGRTEASRLFEASMMDFGNGLMSYSNKSDNNGVGPYTFLPGGLSSGGTTKVVNAVLDEHYHTGFALPYVTLGHAHLVKNLQAALAKGEMAPVSLDWRGDGEWKPAGHEVLGLKIENGRFYFRNPWGNYDAPGAEVGGKDGPRRRIEDRNGVESMPLAELEKSITGITIK